LTKQNASAKLGLGASPRKRMKPEIFGGLDAKPSLRNKTRGSRESLNYYGSVV